MSSQWRRTAIQRTATALFALLIALPVSYAQEPADTVSAPPPAQAAPLLSPEQLSNLVAPIALYPDPLLSQVLAASTYPLEIVEAQQWVEDNRTLSGSQLMDAAKQQNWDPSVQALVAFPDTLKMLASDIRWTTDLGDAFLAQQADVMGAVQNLRARARDNGKLRTTPQQVVSADVQGGQNVIEIMPADPQVIYVPVYQPAYVWGPPAWGYYPDLWYPSGFSFGFGFGPGLYMSSYFPSWGGWGGWGWNCGWFGGRGLYLNFSFFNHYGYRGMYYGGYRDYWGGRYGGRAAWAHNPGHRWGVPYANRNVASRFDGGRMNGGSYSRAGRGGGGPWNGGSRYDSNRGTSQFGRDRSGPSSGGWRGSGDARTAQGRGDVGRTSDSARGSNGWRSFSDGNRSQAGGSTARGFAPSNGSGFRTNGRSDAGSTRQASPNGSTFGTGRGLGSSTQGGRGFSSGQGSWSTRSSERSGGTSSFAAPRSGGGFSSRSYSAPSQSFSAPRSYSGSRGFSGSSGSSAPRSFSGSQGFGGGGGGFSAPRQSAPSGGSFSGSRGFGGGGGFSSGRSSGGGGGGFSGGRSSGGGGGFSGGGRSGGGGGGGHRGR
ncbi:DUF3300 domain-containing protein [uncultured Paludibaculum sp.]|uniref:DUF3300 domain-containing protein n=1 Tax=uncultured Paludibaculum sp. TaxID=1765020 RepID=UPI002AABE814|nr:DUF3300 domain-containing protein [uncultured Paludibaculum sp.]